MNYIIVCFLSLLHFYNKILAITQSEKHISGGNIFQPELHFLKSKKHRCKHWIYFGRFLEQYGFSILLLLCNAVTVHNMYTSFPKITIHIKKY